MLKKVEIWTDGACSFNPGPGGWGAILSYKGIEKIISGGNKETTNNVMELTAVIEGLKMLKEPCLVTLYSDSSYVVNAITQNWLSTWETNGFKTSNNKPVKNRELWEGLSSLLKTHKVTFVLVKGHADNENNNRCDKLARNEVKKLMEVPF